MRLAGRVALLVALWLLAWGDVSVANVVSGIAVAAALLASFPPRRADPDAGAGGPGGPVRVDPLGAARLGLYVAGQLVRSNLLMSVEILRRRPRVRQGVLAHRLERPSEELLTVMTSVIALSPGTMTVDVDDDATTVYVHFFRLDDVDRARAGLATLERLAAAAIGRREVAA